MQVLRGHQDLNFKCRERLCFVAIVEVVLSLIKVVTYSEFFFFKYGLRKGKKRCRKIGWMCLKESSIICNRECRVSKTEPGGVALSELCHL